VPTLMPVQVEAGQDYGSGARIYHREPDMEANIAQPLFRIMCQLQSLCRGHGRLLQCGHDVFRAFSQVVVAPLVRAAILFHVQAALEDRAAFAF
jgi:hypothetical protein